MLNPSNPKGEKKMSNKESGTSNVSKKPLYILNMKQILRIGERRCLCMPLLLESSLLI